MSSLIDDINPDVTVVPFTEETLSPLLTLAGGGVLTATSLELEGRMTYETYEALGTALGGFDRACRWWIGDWLLYGESAFEADRYAQAATLTGLSEQTLLHRITISRAIPPSRRNPRVGYSMHQEVAPLPARQQTRWLNYAEQHRSTRNALRAAIKLARGTGGSTAASGSGADAHESDHATPADLIRQAVVCISLAHGSTKLLHQIDKPDIPPLLEEVEAAGTQWDEIMEALASQRKED